MQTPNEITAVLERMLPVGSIVEWSPVDGGNTDLSSAEKVAAYYGFGTWEAYGSGQMLLGVSSSHAVGSTGGEETHTLTTAEMPSHNHQYATTSRGNTQFPQWYFKLTGTQQETAFRAYGDFTLNKGDGVPHNNMPPFVAVYRWRRVA